MSTFGYIQAPTGTPDYFHEYYRILAAFAENSTARDITFCSPDPAHSGRAVLSGMINSLQRHDVLITMDFLGLGNSTAEILEVMSTLSQRGVKLQVVNARFRLDDNIQAQVVATACSLVSEIELELASRATAAQEQDKGAVCPVDIPAPRKRRSILDSKEQELRTLLAANLSFAEIGRRLGGINRQTLRDFMISRNLSQ